MTQGAPPSLTWLLKDQLQGVTFFLVFVKGKRKHTQSLIWSNIFGEEKMEERKENVGVARAAIVLVCKHSTCWRNLVFGGETQLSRLLQIRQNCWNAVISRFYVWQTPVHPFRPCSCQAVEMIGARSLFSFTIRNDRSFFQKHFSA